MRWQLALVSLLCLCASAPPVWFPGAGFLVLFGWGAFYALCTDESAKRRRLTLYLVGTAHMLFFSFSVRHVLLPAYIGIGVVGGLYYLLTSVWTRTLAKWIPGSLAFGCGLAGALWLRSNFTEIQYPHVQPVHCLYHWPELLLGLRWGGEILMNFVLGALAAGVVDLYRAWRVGQPGFKRSVLTLSGIAAVAVVSWVPWDRLAKSELRRFVDATMRGPVDLLLVEPRMRPVDLHRDYRTLFRTRVLEPTLREAGPGKNNAPDLVVWPESISAQYLRDDGSGLRTEWRRDAVPFTLSPKTQLIQGAVQIGPGDAMKVVALHSDSQLRYLDHHEKQRLVPGGEHQPFLDYLPDVAVGWIRSLFEWAMGIRLPDTTPGEYRPPLTLPRGEKFGVVTCFDNAFPGPFERLSADGASFILVISNESWYLGGAELEQMVAMSVCRAIEVSLPIVRCTVDGATVVVGPFGRIQNILPASDDYSKSRILPVSVMTRLRPDRSVPWLRPWLQGAVLLTLVVLIAPLLRSWGRIQRRRTDSARP